MGEEVSSSEEYYEDNNLSVTSSDEDWMENESPSTSKPVNVINKLGLPLLSRAECRGIFFGLVFIESGWY